MPGSGYIVFNESMGFPCTLLTVDNGLWRRVPEEGILLDHSEEVTLFRTRREARKAIARTKAYFIAQAVRGEDWVEYEPQEYSLRRALQP